MSIDHRVHINTAKSQYDFHFKEGCQESCTVAFLLKHVEKSDIQDPPEYCIQHSVEVQPTNISGIMFMQWQIEEIKDKEQVYMISMAIGWLKLLKEIVLNSVVKTYVSNSI